MTTLFPAAMDEIYERETNSEAAANCNGILQSLSTDPPISKVLQLLIWEDLLRQLKSLSHYLQSPSMHLARAADLVGNFYNRSS